MRRQILVGLAAGLTFLVLDGLLNANPLAQQVYSAYGPIARSSVNAMAGSLVDLAFVHDDRADHGASTRLQPPFVSCIALVGVAVNPLAHFRSPRNSRSCGSV